MFPLCKPPKIIKKEKNKTTFGIEALYPGYGATIGNGLRRVLYSSLEGAAITQVKIKGVQHEFSTLPNVLEDVLQICLNLKQLRFKMFVDIPQTGKLKVKGEREAKGKDLELPSQVEIVNKEAHIATLTHKKAELEMEIQIEKGLGYEPVERRKKPRKSLEIGQIPLDAIFTPIKRVKYAVENMRVGERTDFDRLILEIETDGTISPEQSFVRASQILIEHFSLLEKSFKEKEKSAAEKKPEEKEKEGKPKEGKPKERKPKEGKPKEGKPKEGKPKEDALTISVQDLKLSGRVLNVLLKNKIETAEGIIKKGEKKILELEGMGEKGAKEVKRALKRIGLEL